MTGAVLGAHAPCVLGGLPAPGRLISCQSLAGGGAAPRRPHQSSFARQRRRRLAQRPLQAKPTSVAAPSQFCTFVSPSRAPEKEIKKRIEMWQTTTARPLLPIRQKDEQRVAGAEPPAAPVLAAWRRRYFRHPRFCRCLGSSARHRATSELRDLGSGEARVHGESKWAFPADTRCDRRVGDKRCTVAA